MRDVSNSADVLDIRDIITRFEELKEERAELVDALDEAKKEADLPAEDEDTEEDRKANVSAAEIALREWDCETGEGEEFASLESLLSELCGSGGDHQWKGDWYPVTLIRDSYFVEAMQELVQDIGDLPRNIPGYLEIDWEKTADNLKADYSQVDFGGTTYYYR